MTKFAEIEQLHLELDRVTKQLEDSVAELRSLAQDLRDQKKEEGDRGQDDR